MHTYTVDQPTLLHLATGGFITLPKREGGYRVEVVGGEPTMLHVNVEGIHGTVGLYNVDIRNFTPATA